MLLTTYESQLLFLPELQVSWEVSEELRSKVAMQCLTILLDIWKVPDKNIGHKNGYSGWHFPWISSINSLQYYL
jgi:hypothetical protein